MKPAEYDVPEQRPQRHRAIWISDVHLGTPGCKAEYLLDFLKWNESDQLYLVGDIIDGWQLRKGWYWRQSHNDVIQKILRKARKGTHVTYIAGNHDEVIRQFLGMAFGEIKIVDEATHQLLDGRRIWVTHGDLFDGIILHAKWLAYLGDSMYTVILKLNNWFNHFRHKMGMSYWSLSQYLKHKVKNAVSFITKFENIVTDEARRRGYDGVLCGHIHKAEIRDINGILYCNDGDWVESLSAIVETSEGALKVVHWPYRTSESLDEQEASSARSLSARDIS
jgi:UDP-2,3-diacylglucosamine pyrophosphatase LpxH